MGQKKLLILIDADIISHFIVAGEVPSLHTIFDNKLVILDKVLAELRRFPGKRQVVENLLSFKILNEMPFPEEDQQIKKEYFYIKNKLFKGDGESACLAVVRYSHDILASSNLKDTKHYCSLHNIKYITTMDFLCAALAKGVFTHQRCCEFVMKVIAADSKLPTKDFNSWVCRDINLT